MEIGRNAMNDWIDEILKKVTESPETVYSTSTTEGIQTILTDAKNTKDMMYNVFRAMDLAEIPVETRAHIIVISAMQMNKAEYIPIYLILLMAYEDEKKK